MCALLASIYTYTREPTAAHCSLCSYPHRCVCVCVCVHIAGMKSNSIHNLRSFADVRALCVPLARAHGAIAIIPMRSYARVYIYARTRSPAGVAQMLGYPLGEIFRHRCLFQ